MPITIYGIKNCDTMKKARSWLDDRGVAYTFHDYKTAGVERAMLERWARASGWETLLNRAGTTFRKLPDKDKEGLTEKKAMARNPVALIIPCHRVLAAGGKIGGFSAPGGSTAKMRMLELEGVRLEPPPSPQSSFGF